MQEFAQLLAYCAQSDEEVIAFIEAFARVRLDGISRALTDATEAVEEAEEMLHPDWHDKNLLAESGIEPGAIAEINDPESRYLHIDVALAHKRKAISTFLDMTGLSDKQRGDLFPHLSSQRGGADRSQIISEVQRLNRMLDFARTRNVAPETFVAYHHHLAIHGASQNFSGAVGAMGAAIAFLDALEELSPGCVEDMAGRRPPEGIRTPEQIADYIATGTDAERKRKKVTALRLSNGRFVVFSSDPDCSICVPLVKGVGSAADALKLYNQVRKSTEKRRQALHEFAVGEVKTATDPSNLHERLALGGRENKVDVNADRFLMMALLTKDILEGGTGQKSGRAPLQNRDTVRFSHVFNLHHAWGWDGGRERHPEHWETFKATLKGWCGL